MSAPVDSTLVRVAGLHKRFARPEGEVHVLRGIDLEIERGAAVAVVGVSGAGKSTLLHVLGTLEQPSEGTVTINSVYVGSMSSNNL